MQNTHESSWYASFCAQRVCVQIQSSWCFHLLSWFYVKNGGQYNLTPFCDYSSLMCINHYHLSTITASHSCSRSYSPLSLVIWVSDTYPPQRGDKKEFHAVQIIRVSLTFLNTSVSLSSMSMVVFFKHNRLQTQTH